MTFMPIAAFVLSALALLGSPGPGIAALLLAGRQRGWTGAQPFFWGLQAGLALSSGLCALGLAAAVLAIPAMLPALMFGSSLYLIWLAAQIIRSADQQAEAKAGLWSSSSGLWVGVSNPKSLLAFVTLFGSQLLVGGNGIADAGLKWVLTVLVMIIVDLGWLWFGVRLGATKMSAGTHRRVNLGFGVILGCTALLGLGEAVLLTMDA